MTENGLKYNQLELLENQLQRCDEELLILLKRRFHTIKKIGDYKKKNGHKVVDYDIEDKELQKRSTKAREMQIDVMFADEFFGLVYDESRKILKSIDEK